jgi:hypothetical protein
MDVDQARRDHIGAGVDDLAGRCLVDTGHRDDGPVVDVDRRRS